MIWKRCLWKNMCGLWIVWMYWRKSLSSTFYFCEKMDFVLWVMWKNSWIWLILLLIVFLLKCKFLLKVLLWVWCLLLWCLFCWFWICLVLLRCLCLRWLLFLVLLLGWVDIRIEMKSGLLCIRIICLSRLNEVCMMLCCVMFKNSFCTWVRMWMICDLWWMCLLRCVCIIIFLSLKNCFIILKFLWKMCMVIECVLNLMSILCWWL